MRGIVCTSVPIEQALQERLAPRTLEIVNTAAQLEATLRSDAKALAFVDGPTLQTITSGAALGPVIAICDGPLQTAIGWLGAYPWLSHVVSASMLQLPMATTHLGNVVASFADEGKPRLLDRVRDSLTGRRVSIIQANRRVERIEKLSEFFDSKGVGPRTIQQLRDAAEELLTNAFYDAPVAAGAVAGPISRTLDVTLPEETPCDVMYGCTDDFAVVHVRDPFGALSRTRMVEVLTRCARTDMRVEVDESMGGAGLGLWRIFSVASFVAISVVQGHHTDVLVGVGIGQRGPRGQRPYAFHLFFRESARPRRWRLTGESQVERSFTAVESSER